MLILPPFTLPPCSLHSSSSKRRQAHPHLAVTAMDGVSPAAAIITILGATNEAIQFCRHYALSARNAPQRIQQFLEELRGLRKELEAVDELLRPRENADPADNPNMENILALCAENGPIQQHMEQLNEKLRPPELPVSNKSKWKAISQSLKWPLNEGEAEEVLETIQRQKGDLVMALQINQTSVSPPFPSIPPDIK